MPQSASLTAASDADGTDTTPESDVATKSQTISAQATQVPTAVVEHRRAAVHKARLVRQASGVGVLGGL